MPNTDPSDETRRAPRQRPDAARDREPEATAEPSAPAGPDEQVDETSEESFPASDPPAWSQPHAGSPEPDDAGPGR